MPRLGHVQSLSEQIPPHNELVVMNTWQWPEVSERVHDGVLSERQHCFQIPADSTEEEHWLEH